MEYTTYWSILDSPSHTIKSNLIGLFIALFAGFCWILAKKYKRDSGDGDRMIILWGTGVLTVLGIAMFFLLTFITPDNSDAETAKMLQSAKVKKVEGIVSHFNRRFRNTRLGAETIESFNVDTVKFAYGDALLGKFNSFTKTNNDVIFNGQSVRITYGAGSPYGDSLNSIWKLEIGR